jgi:hypothetical protein
MIKTCPQALGLLYAKSEVRPRRKATDSDGRRPESVMITHDIISRLMDYPLSEAASRLGISATAFKKACRKLGLKRWTYTKHGSRNSIVKDASQLVAPTSAYAKRIFRKYSPCSKRPNASKSGYEECDSGKSKIEHSASNTETETSQVSTPEQLDNTLRAEALNESTSSTWSGPLEESVGPLNISDVEQIFGEDLLFDDECAFAMLCIVWKQSTFDILHDH